MNRKYWMLAVPLLFALGAGGSMFWNPLAVAGGNGRIVDAEFVALEKELGYHLYAPTWLPRPGKVGELGPMRGEHRILQDYSTPDGSALLFLAQERRTGHRDAYHDERFVKRADAKAHINGRPAYFVTGSSGERRLFWLEGETVLILSSSVLTDTELVKVAQKVR